MVSYINRQGGLSSRHLFTLAERLLRWAQLNLRLLRAAHVPGKLNLGADMPSRSTVPSDKWTLHPQTVQVIWGIFGRPEVDLFASEYLHSLPKLFLDRDVIIKDRLAPDRPDPAGNQANQGAEAQSYVSGPTLEEPALVLGAGAAAHCSPMAHYPDTRPPLSGERNDLAPPARFMGATSLAS